MQKYVALNNFFYFQNMLNFEQCFKCTFRGTLLHPDFTGIFCYQTIRVYNASAFGFGSLQCFCSSFVFLLYVMCCPQFLFITRIVFSQLIYDF